FHTADVDSWDYGLAPLAGDHDLILGTPFLSQFKLCISVADHSSFCCV
ncbi:hypothetical protein VP01_3175g1, partial [Puccinia sorghi]